MLFMRGKAMSGAPIIRGTNQLPKPPINAGMTVFTLMLCGARSFEAVMVRPWMAAHKDIVRSREDPAPSVPDATHDSKRVTRGGDKLV